MKIINSQKASWYLLQANNNVYISINSGCGAMSYSIEFEMNVEECQQYTQQGIVYINQLVQQVNNVQKTFLTRSLCIELSTQIHEIISETKSAQ